MRIICNFLLPTTVLLRFDSYSLVLFTLILRKQDKPRIRIL